MRGIDSSYTSDASPHALRLYLVHPAARWVRALLWASGGITVLLAVVGAPLLAGGPQGPEPYSDLLRGCSKGDFEDRDFNRCRPLLERSGMHRVASPATIADRAAQQAFAPLASPTEWRPYVDHQAPDMDAFAEAVRHLPSGNPEPWMPLDPEAIAAGVESDDPELASRAVYLSQHTHNLVEWRNGVEFQERNRQGASLQSIYQEEANNLLAARNLWGAARLRWSAGLACAAGFALTFPLFLGLFVGRRWVHPIPVELTRHQLAIGNRVLPIEAIGSADLTDGVTITLLDGTTHRIRPAYRLPSQDAAALRDALNLLVGRTSEDRSDALRRLRAIETSA